MSLIYPLPLSRPSRKLTLNTQTGEYTFELYDGTGNPANELAAGEFLNPVFTSQ